MKKVMTVVLLLAVLTAFGSCRVSSSTKALMRERSANRSRHNIGVLFEQAKKDITEYVSDAAQTLKEGYDEYSPVVKEKGGDILSGIKENAPDIAKSYVDHQNDFWEETLDRFKDSPVTLPEPEPKAPEGVELSGPYSIAWVSDGDTFAIDLPDGKQTYVRLIGIDTPESIASDEYLEKSGKANCPEGKQSSEFTKALLKETGMRCWLESDAQDTDPYDRWLRYVYIDIDGELKMLNKVLLEEGMARLCTIPPNVRYADTILLDAQQKAIEKKKGHWDSGFYKEE